MIFHLREGHLPSRMSPAKRHRSMPNPGVFVCRIEPHDLPPNAPALPSLSRSMSLLFRTSAGNKNQTGENLSKSLSTAVNRLSPVRHFTTLHYPFYATNLRRAKLVSPFKATCGYSPMNCLNSFVSLASPLARVLMDQKKSTMHSAASAIFGARWLVSNVPARTDWMLVVFCFHRRFRTACRRGVRFLRAREIEF